MKTKKRVVGDIGENIAVKFLEKKGFKTIEKNYLKKIGEIDIVAHKNNDFYFFEVKTISVDFDNLQDIRIIPEDNFTQNKIIKFNRIVEFYIKSKKIKNNYSLGALFIYIDIKKKKSKIRFMEKLEL